MRHMYIQKKNTFGRVVLYTFDAYKMYKTNISLDK